MADNGNGNGGPWWVKAAASFGVPALIVFYLLGMIPGARSPFDRISDEFRAAAQAMTEHERTAREFLRVSRHICRGIWRGDAVMQAGCSRNGNPPDNWAP